MTLLLLVFFFLSFFLAFSILDFLIFLCVYVYKYIDRRSSLVWYVKVKWWYCWAKISQILVISILFLCYFLGIFSFFSVCSVSVTLALFSHTRLTCQKNLTSCCHVERSISFVGPVRPLPKFYCHEYLSG